jgi:hypothetical protein
MLSISQGLPGLNATNMAILVGEKLRRALARARTSSIALMTIDPECYERRGLDRKGGRRSDRYYTL